VLTSGSTTPLPSTVSITFSIWDVGSDGKPVLPAKATKTATLSTALAFNGGFKDVTFDSPVPVSGSFFYGYSQPGGPLNFFPHFGADFNSSMRANTVYDFGLGQWTALTNASTPMLRAVMTGVVTSTRTPKTSADIQVYPNPSRGEIQVAGNYKLASVVDVLGRLVWQQPQAQAGQATLNLQQLPAGVYLLRLTLPDGSLSTHRLVLEK
jgi:hypothetical protein